MRREEEGKKMEETRSSKPRYGNYFVYGTLDFCMETHLDYEFYEIWHGFLGWYDD